VQISDEMKPGLANLPHGCDHDLPGAKEVATLSSSEEFVGVR